MNGGWSLKVAKMLTLKNHYGVRIMHTYEKAPGGSRQSPGYTGLIAIICLFASIFFIVDSSGTTFALSIRFSTAG